MFSATLRIVSLVVQKVRSQAGGHACILCPYPVLGNSASLGFSGQFDVIAEACCDVAVLVFCFDKFIIWTRLQYVHHAEHREREVLVAGVY